MKNKKVKLAILVLAVLTLFTTAVFASTNSNEGYEAFKQVLVKSHDLQPFTSAALNGTLQITDNGKTIAELKGTVKGNKDGDNASGTVRFNQNGKQLDLSFFKNGDATYLVDETGSRYYQLVNLKEDAEWKHNASIKEEYSGEQRMNKSGEAFLDYVMGDLKSQFALSQNADGTRSITLDLQQNEIPELVNLMFSAAVENKSRYSGSGCDSAADPAKMELLKQKLPFLSEFEGMHDTLPNLTQDIKLTNLYFRLNTDENSRIQSFDVKMNISGRDAQGTSHELSLSGTAAVGGINSTSADTFNPEGKNIEIIDAAEFDCSRK